MTTKTLVRVAVVQLDAVPGDVTGNVDRLVQAVAKHGPHADLLVAPELATTGYDLDLVKTRGPELAETSEGPSMRRLADACEEANCTLVVGFLEVNDGRLYDSIAIITAKPSVNVYRKTHLYPDELPHFAAGTELITVTTPAGVVAPMNCFEHAFPEISMTLALAGAQILVIPSCVPRGYEHLLTLRTRARAQDNQVFAVASNMVGHGFCGKSLIVDPRGDVLAEAGGEESVIAARLDLKAIERERFQEPALSMRQPGLYGERSGKG